MAIEKKQILDKIDNNEISLDIKELFWYISNISNFSSSRKDIIEKTQELIKKINSLKDEWVQGMDISRKQSVLLEITELLENLLVSLKRSNPKSELDPMLFSYFEQRLWDIVSPWDKNNTIIWIDKISQLVTSTSKEISITVTAWLWAHGVISYLWLFENQQFVQAIEKWAPVVQTGLAGLIILSTSIYVNLTLNKRAETDKALVKFTNSINQYAREIGIWINNSKLGNDEKEKVLSTVNYFFNNLAFNVIDRSKSDSDIPLGYDVILRSLKQIYDNYGPHVPEDPVTKTHFSKLHQNCITSLNDLSALANLRAPRILEVWNSNLIRWTYFISIALQSLTFLPAQIFFNFAQRFFHTLAQDIDKSIQDDSVASIPVENRVVKVIARVGKLLSVNNKEVSWKQEDIPN